MGKWMKRGRGMKCPDCNAQMIERRSGFLYNPHWWCGCGVHVSPCVTGWHPIEQEDKATKRAKKRWEKLNGHKPI